MKRSSDIAAWPIFVLAVTAISTSALLVRWAEAPAVSLAFWRTLGGASLLSVVSLRQTSGRVPTSLSTNNAPSARPNRQQWRLLILAGFALAVHFATWLTSLNLTSVAASVSLGATAPIMVAGAAAFRGTRTAPRTWIGIGLAVAGAVLIAFGDQGVESSDGDVGLGRQTERLLEAVPNALLGDALALVGAVAVAVYFVAGSGLRQQLATSVYTSRAYAVAAGLLGAFCLVSGNGLTGYSGETWLTIGAMILGPQMIGHTGLNYLLGRLSALTVALALLIEPVAATGLAWAFLSEIPSTTTLVGGLIVLCGVGLHLSAKTA